MGSNVNLEEGTCEAVEPMGKVQSWQSKDDGVVEVTNQRVAKVRSAVLVKGFAAWSHAPHEHWTTLYRARYIPSMGRSTSKFATMFVSKNSL